MDNKTKQDKVQLYSKITEIVIGYAFRVDGSTGARLTARAEAQGLLWS